MRFMTIMMLFKTCFERYGGFSSKFKVVYWPTTAGVTVTPAVVVLYIGISVYYINCCVTCYITYCLGVLKDCIATLS